MQRPSHCSTQGHLKIIPLVLDWSRSLTARWRRLRYISGELVYGTQTFWGFLTTKNQVVYCRTALCKQTSWATVLLCSSLRFCINRRSQKVSGLFLLPLAHKSIGWRIDLAETLFWSRRSGGRLVYPDNGSVKGMYALDWASLVCAMRKDESSAIEALPEFFRSIPDMFLACKWFHHYWRDLERGTGHLSGNGRDTGPKGGGCSEDSYWIGTCAITTGHVLSFLSMYQNDFSLVPGSRHVLLHHSAALCWSCFHGLGVNARTGLEGAVVEVNVMPSTAEHLSGGFGVFTASEPSKD